MMKKLITLLMAATMTAAMVITSLAATKLDTPDGLYWDEDDETIAYWDEVEDAKQYEVYLYRVSDSDSTTKVADIKTKKTKYDFGKKMTKEGDYYFKVKALAKSGYSDSSWSDESDYSYISENYAEWLAGGKKNPDTSTTGPGVVNTEEQTTENAVVTSGAGWRQNEIGWWYATNEEGTEWLLNCWQWIDGNGDGTAECYYFDNNGYMLANTTTPDGYTVNADGAWMENGVVQIKSMQ